MITLDTERGPQEVDWEYIETHLNFAKDLDPSKHQLEKIIGRYHVKEKVRCGLSNCHTPHGRGYVVLTSDGFSTNIGKDCGKHYFGAEFTEMHKQFDRKMTDTINRNALHAFVAQKLDAVEASLTDLFDRANGARWVVQQIGKLKAGPAEIASRISTMTKQRSGTLAIQRKATKREMEAREATGNAGDEYIEETVAVIAGIQAMYPENDLRALLVKSMREKLESFKSQNIGEMESKALKDWVQWVNEIDRTLSAAEASVRFGNELFTKSNLEPLFSLLKQQEDIAIWKAFLNSLPK